jgi:hypothetical protein
MVKLLMSWDIRSGQEGEYFEFILQEFRPGLKKLGVRPTDAWYTTYGDDPQILEGAVVQDLETVNRIMVSDDWRRLKRKLLTLVTNYQQKVVAANGRFQL